MNINEAMAVLDDLCGKEGLFSVAWKTVRTRILNAATEARQVSERSHNSDYMKCCDEIEYACRTMAYPTQTIIAILKRHFS